MLSILIPTYNYDILPLAREVHKQASNLKSDFEIIIMDDASPVLGFDKNELNRFSNLRFIELPQNIGRSSIRNRLAKTAKYEWCLFLDADVLPVNTNFIDSYLKAISKDSEVINGGILYQDNNPDNIENLRWVYGRKREALSCEQRNKNVYLSFLTLNFMIRKSLFERICFNEDIPNLRHEDTLFSFNLKEQGIKVEHITNPVYHMGLEDSKTFLDKSLKSVEALSLLVSKKLLPYQYTRISKVYQNITTWGLNSLCAFIYLKFKLLFERHLLGKRPSLFIFDLYRLSYYCYINKKN
ncbi:glycosyltransferase family 2 protein [Winogradskyella aurantia]|uniref:Glycosyl transferase n=1 Tax=Winogradskyella aurantia TaxID=1915063 RepID=A0A265UUM6_9FLAO|nr:glycosyltransferase [Winogradskyella aurantia]OZV69015.1 glycosyl transferase [Winogradskyella aurantia]